VFSVVPDPRPYNEDYRLAIFSSERMLHKNYYRKGSVEKETLVVGLKELDAKPN
jgi:hypothetical protein